MHSLLVAAPFDLSVVPITAAAKNFPGSSDENHNVFAAKFNSRNADGFVFPAYLNDLWKYTLSNNSWTWLAGDKGGNDTGGSAFLAARSGAACAWNGPLGQFIIFGGSGLISGGGSAPVTFADVWFFTASNLSMSLAKGPKNVDGGDPYAIGLGIEGGENLPGGRYAAAAALHPENQQMWIFGGTLANVSTGNQASLWSFSVTRRAWTWVDGPLTQAYGNYSARTQESAIAAPGSRYGHQMFMDMPLGELWVFGGLGFANTTIGALNCLFRYRFSTGNWTWMSGAANADSRRQGTPNGNYGANNIPGARAFAGGALDLSNRTMIIFGGEGFTNVSSPGTTTGHSSIPGSSADRFHQACSTMFGPTHLSRNSGP